MYVVCPLIGQDAEARDKRAGGRGREADEEAYEFASISIESDADFAGDNVTAATKDCLLYTSEIDEQALEGLHAHVEQMRGGLTDQLDALLELSLIHI